MIHTSHSNTSWHTFVAQHASGSFYHDPMWLDLLTKIYGYSVIPLTATNARGEITGVLPLCFLQSPLTGQRLVSLPFSDYCSLLATDETSTNDLIDQAIQLARQRKARYLELRTGPNQALAQRSELTEGDLYVRWLLPLAADPQAVWSRLRKPVQRQIKKSQGIGVQVQIARNREDMAHYYHLHLRTRMKHGMPAQPQRFFFALWDRFAQKGNVQLLLASYQGSIIAGMILIASGTTVRYAYGASDEHYLHLAPNNLLMWSAITWSCEQGHQQLDLGRTARDNKGLMEFKRRWGAVEEPLPYYYYPQRAGLVATAESSRKFRLFTTCWRQLPLAIAGPLGGYLYRHLG
jgi:FemAB-related protein (PEP-CTERM system-associated)